MDPNATSSPTPGFFDDAFAQQAKVDQLRSSMSYAITQNPEQFSQATQVGRKLGVTAPTVLGDPQPYTRAAQMQDFDAYQFIKQTPALASYWANPSNAAQTHDDWSSLSGIETNLKDIGTQALLALPKTWGQTISALGGGMRTIGAATHLEGLQNAGAAIQDYERPLFTDPDMLPTTTAGRATAFVGGIAGSFQKAMLAGATGQPWAVPAAFGAEAFGAKGGEALQEGAQPWQALVEGLGSGAINAGLGFVTGPAPQMVNGQVVKQALLQSLLQRGIKGTALGGMVTLGENLLSRIHDPNRPITQGMVENIANFLGMEAAGGVQEWYTNRQLQALQAAGDAAGSSKMAQRDPAGFQDLVQSMADGSGAEHIMVPADRLTTFFQSQGVDPAAGAESLGVKNFQEASATGDDAIVPTAGFLSQLTPDQQRALMPDIRVSPGALTQNELAEQGHSLGQDLARSHAAMAQAEPPIDPTRQSIFDQTRQTLLDSGYEPSTADAYAQAHTQAMVTLAGRAGIDPADLQDRYALQVFRPRPGEDVTDAILRQAQARQAEQPGDGETYFQPAPMDFGSKEWNEYYGLMHGSRALGDQAQRARSAMRASLTDRGGREFDAQRELEMRTNEDLFQQWDKEVKGLQAGEVHGEDNRGFLQFGEDRKMNIGLLQKADLSTFLHESGHFYLEMMKDLVQEPNASEQLKQDYQTVRDWLGAKDGENISQEQHEQFARGNEAYLMEGKAPSENLQGVFSRFKGWLSLIYRKLTNLGVQLTPEVRGVFDRIYASDQEIDAAKTRIGGDRPFFASAEDMGVSPAEFELYKSAVAKSVAAAKEELAQKVLAEHQRKQEQAWKAELHDVRKEVADQVDQDPVQRTWKSLVEGKTEDGTPIKLDRQGLVDRIGEESTKALKRSGEAVYTREGGTDLDTAADLLGYQSGDELARALRDMEPRDQVIERLANEEMTRRHGDMLTDGTIADKANDAVHNRFQADALVLELRALRAKAREAGPFMDWQKRMDAAKSEEERQRVKSAWEAYQADQARRTAEQKAAARGATQMPSTNVIREAARASVESQPVRNVIPYRYMLAERTASREAFDAMARGDYQTAAKAKQRELMNHFLYHEALKVRAEADGIQDYVQGAMKVAGRQRLGKAGGDFLAQQDGILNRYEFQNVSSKELDRRRSLQSWAQDQALKGEQPAIDPQILDETRRANWRDIPITELRSIKDALTNIHHLAGRETELRVGESKANFADAKEEIANALTSAFKVKPIPADPNVPKTQLEGAAGKLRGVDAMLIRMEQIANWVDKNDVNGPFHRYLWNPIAEAQTRESDMAADITAKLQAAMEEMPKEQRESLLDKFEVPGMTDPQGRPFSPTRKYLISMLFNMGNEANRAKMMEGMGWANKPELLAEAFSHLNSHDAKFVQDTWNTINELWPHIADLQRRMTGLEPPKVEALPFQLDLADGRYNFEGGYYPLKGDPLRSTTGAKQEFGSVVQLTDKGFERPQTSTGHTKERTAAAYPLLMDFESILGRHVTQVIQDVTHREAVVAAYKVISDPEIRQAMTETMGEEYMRQMLPWLRTVVNDRNDSATQGLDWLSRWMGSARRNTVAATMGYKLSTALVQYTGITRSMHYVGASDLLQAIGQFAAHPTQTIEMVRELSGEMRNRAENLDRDYREMMAAQTGKNGFMAGLNKFAFEGISAADAGIGIPTWLGAYNQALKAGKGKDTAVLEADRAVRLTQPTAGPKDLPAIMRQNDTAKLLTMFYGHFSVLYQNLRDTGHQVQGFQDAPSVAASLLRSVLIPAIAGEIILARGPDDDENKGKWAILKGLHFASSSIPLLRDLAKPLTDYIEGKQGDYRFSPVVEMFKKNADMAMALAGSAGAAKADHPLDDTAWKTAEALGYDFGVPGTAQAVASGRYLQKVAAGETNDTPGQAAAHLAFGYHPKK